MKKIINLLIGFFAICMFVISCKNADDQLAYRISKSDSFKAMMMYGKQMSNRIKQMPDSNKNRLKEFQNIYNKLLKSNDLTVFQKRDSVAKLVKLQSFFNSEFTHEAISMGPVYASFNKEFPEFKNLSKEEKSIVFQKAATIFIRDSNYKK